MAAIRANEGKRRDAVFRDPLAALLAGERGLRIARSIPRAAMVHWGVVARTSAIDRLLHDALESGVDTIVNLGAGLDTRPFRMDLPATLRWVEIDFPEIVDVKRIQLAGHAPKCRLEYKGVDLLDQTARRECLAACTARSQHVAILTEGVISYFSNDEVWQLATELLAIPSIRTWIQDFDNAGRRGLPIGWEKRLEAAPFRFDVVDWFSFFRNAGWSPSNIITTISESERLGRAYPWDLPYGLLLRALPKDVQRKILSLSGAVRLQRG